MGRSGHAGRARAWGISGRAGGWPYARWTVTSTADLVLLVGAGALAGTVGTAGGITSLISYPALLAVGVPPLPANVTNIVALVACGPGSALASRPELAGKGPWLRHWAGRTRTEALS